MHTKNARIVWQYANTLRELEEWRIWVADTAQKFEEELRKTGINNKTDAIINITNELQAVGLSMKKLNKDMRKIEGRRIHRPKAA